MTEIYSDGDERPIPSTADFWRSLGHNVIPARCGKPIEDWKKWQYEQIPKSQHEVWKYNHSFDYGMMIMLGKSWVSSQYLWVAIPTRHRTGIVRSGSKLIQNIVVIVEPSRNMMI